MRSGIKAIAPKDEAGFRDHVQKITDDVRLLLNNGGLTFENLPMQMYTTQATSGVSIDVLAYGAFVVYSAGIITSTQYNTLKNGLLQVTLTFATPGTYQTTLVLIKEKLPS